VTVVPVIPKLLKLGDSNNRVIDTSDIPDRPQLEPVAPIE
jgi:hypothetical protein